MLIGTKSTVRKIYAQKDEKFTVGRNETHKAAVGPTCELVARAAVGATRELVITGSEMHEAEVGATRELVVTEDKTYEVGLGERKFTFIRISKMSSKPKRI